MKTIPVILTAILAFLFSGCGSVKQNVPVGAYEEKSTAVIKYIPRDVPRTERTGSCWTNSIAAPRGDAWRCMVGNEIYDPCFSLGPAVVCDVNPALNQQGFRLNLEKPLPSSPPIDVEANTGWLIELADGGICNRATGARGMVDGRMTTYYCTSRDESDSTTVLGELKTGTVWTADIAVTDRATGKIRGRKILPVARVWQ